MGRDQYGVNLPNGYASGQKLGHLYGVTLLTVEKVQAISDLLDRNCIFVSPMLEDKLLEEQKGAFMWNFLPDLNEGFPCVFGGKPRAVWTLCVLDEELDLEDLLKDRGS